MTVAARLARWSTTLALALAACAPTALSLATRPAVPPGWTAVEADTGDLRLMLPTYLHVSDKSGAIFANELPPAVGAWIEVVAEGPRTAEPQPAAGESLATWLERRTLAGEPVPHQSTTRSVILPSGDGLELIAALMELGPGP